MKKCVFAGTFDPFTVGHADTVGKCLRLFDEVVIAVAENRNKQCMFDANERLAMIKAVYAKEPRVRVLQWNGVIVDLLAAEQTPFYVRGVRNLMDFEYENADFYASRKLDREFFPIYLPAEQDFLHISATIVRNSIAYGKPYRDYVPEAVYEYIQTRGKHV